jgi:hypothetical protein
MSRIFKHVPANLHSLKNFTREKESMFFEILWLLIAFYSKEKLLKAQSGVEFEATFEYGSSLLTIGVNSERKL